LSLKVKLTGTPFKYLKSLDKPTKKRIEKKLTEIAENPADPRLSYSLEATEKRCTRVGGYRILFTIEEEILLVADIGPRGQIYRKT
jgi:mRNA-degrading endonuclease RelE of RelBE toxin-antitoxin system